MSSQAVAPTRTKAAPALTVAPVGLLQRQCDCGQHTTAGGECEECKKKKSVLQRHASSGTEPASVPPIVHEVLRAPGQPLDRATRDFMEPRFGHDFSNVRVHTDAKAAESARAVNALAYTVGHNVAFRAGVYAPATSAGQRLLAHELAHVVQQGHDVSVQRHCLSISPMNNQQELEADQVAERVTNRSGSSRGLTQVGTSLQRKESEPFGPKELKDVKICGPDVTSWLVQKMKINEKGNEVQVMKNLNSSSKQGTTIGALALWTRLVKTGGPWDFKTVLGKNLNGISPCRTNCAGMVWSVTLAGRCMTYEAPANIHFGYIGRHAGFSERTLLTGAALAQIGEARGETKDDPRDVQAIKKGFQLFNSGDPSGLTSAGLDQNYFENLGSKDGDPVGCEPCVSKLS